MKRSALGKGLDSLISMDDIQTGGSSAINEIAIAQIKPNPDQPRQNFDEEALAEHQALAAAYEAYIDNMFELRAQAKAAYDSLAASEAFVINARRKRLGED